MDIIANIPIENNIKKETHMQLLNIIKDEFTTNEQKLFVESFQLYLQYDDENEFIIELDNIWKWLGFCRLAGCKRVLVKNFQKDIDFKISFTQVGEKESSINIGRPKENILMTIKCFKKLCTKNRC
jgi:hypothetical protein